MDPEPWIVLTDVEETDQPVIVRLSQIVACWSGKYVLDPGTESQRELPCGAINLKVGGMLFVRESAAEIGDMITKAVPSNGYHGRQ